MSSVNKNPSLPYRLLLSNLARIEVGSMTVRLADGHEEKFEGERPGPSGIWEIHNPRLIRRLISGGAMGLAESYMAGEWDSPDLTEFLRVCEINRSAFEALDRGQWMMRLVQWLIHAVRANSKRGAKRNIASHYDLGNDFYRLWLDPTMTYSSAIFERADQALEQAQVHKYDRIIERLQPTDQSHLLEIGSGWGGFATRVVQETGCRVTSITLSKEQLAEAERRVYDAGLSDRITFKLEDYRDTRGEYDGIASIEMFEAVGESYWPEYFRVVHDRLTKTGVAALQVITIRDDLFESYRKGVDFIQRYIFPGGMLPAPGIFKTLARQSGLVASGECFYGLDYARTLREWDERFKSQLDAVKRMGFDDHFVRMWRYYLNYCQAGFIQETINLMQVSLRRV